MTWTEQTKLYTGYHDKVFGYIRARVGNKEDAEDLCAEVFERILRASGSYDAAKASPGTWIYAITHNVVIDFFRQRRPSEELPEELSDVALPEEDILQTELLDALAAALEQLDAELVDIIVLHYYDCMPLTKIAGTLGLSYGAVKLRHQKALALLRRLLEN